jgi:predicted RNase H-related nuclease YkuK (DUF458 family)
MNATFKRLSDHKEVDLIPYVQELITGVEDVKIYIGTDSQTNGAWTQYATVIVLHWGNRGASVLYAKERLPRINDMFTRLWNEVERSIQAAEFMVNSGLPRANYIDLDYNPDPKYNSNSILRSAVGYVESMGYEARVKPEAIIASSCADTVCH